LFESCKTGKKPAEEKFRIDRPLLPSALAPTTASPHPASSKSSSSATSSRSAARDRPASTFADSATETSSSESKTSRTETTPAFKAPPAVDDEAVMPDSAGNQEDSVTRPGSRRTESVSNKENKNVASSRQRVESGAGSGRGEVGTPVLMSARVQVS
jgi:hypothetical protein